MSLCIAPTCNPARLIGWHARARGSVHQAQMRAANDDDGNVAVSCPVFDPLLTDALRHFATHGLGAVEAALAEVKHAHTAGDSLATAHWLAVAGALDRRRAAAASAALNHG